MADPFDALRTPVVPLAPRERFASELRQRLIAETRGGRPMTQPTTGRTGPGGRRPRLRTVATPYLAVHDARAALDWYGRALGAVEAFRMEMPDGRVGHAELTIGDATLFLSDESPEVQALSPRTLGGSAVLLHLVVQDVDDSWERAVAEGATPDRPPADQGHGHRHGVLVDPFGHRWMLSTPLEPEPLVQGVTPYLYYEDGAAALDWLVGTLGFEEIVRYVDGTGRVAEAELRAGAGEVHLAGRAPQPGEGGGQLLIVHVTDVDALHDRVLAAGGDPDPPQDAPYGVRRFEVVDPWGYRWDLWQHLSDDVRLPDGWQELRPRR